MAVAVWQDSWARVPQIPPMEDRLPDSAPGARIGPYEVLDFLGKGEFARVHACRRIAPPIRRRGSSRGGDRGAPPPRGSSSTASLQPLPTVMYAIKTISKEHLIHRSDTNRTVRRIKRVGTEIDAMLRCASPVGAGVGDGVGDGSSANGAYGGWADDGDGMIVKHEEADAQHTNARFICGLVAVFHSSSRVYLVMEKGGRDLYDAASKWPASVPPERTTRRIVASVAAAVSHFHAVGVSHRDLKPENVLVRFTRDAAGRIIDIVDVKVCDFGLCALSAPLPPRPSARAAAAATATADIDARARAAAEAAPIDGPRGSPVTVLEAEAAAAAGTTDGKDGGPIWMTAAPASGVGPLTALPRSPRGGGEAAPPLLEAPVPRFDDGGVGDDEHAAWVAEMDRAWTLSDFAGSPGFYAPEILLRDSYDGRAADVFSTGCIALELAIGATPFAEVWMKAYANANIAQRDAFDRSLRNAFATIAMGIGGGGGSSSDRDPRGSGERGERRGERGGGRSSRAANHSPGSSSRRTVAWPSSTARTAVLEMLELSPKRRPSAPQVHAGPWLARQEFAPPDRGGGAPSPKPAASSLSLIVEPHGISSSGSSPDAAAAAAHGGSDGRGGPDDRSLGGGGAGIGEPGGPLHFGAGSGLGGDDDAQSPVACRAKRGYARPPPPQPAAAPPTTTLEPIFFAEPVHGGGGGNGGGAYEEQYLDHHRHGGNGGGGGHYHEQQQPQQQHHQQRFYHAHSTASMGSPVGPGGPNSPYLSPSPRLPPAHRGSGGGAHSAYPSPGKNGASGSATPRLRGGAPRDGSVTAPPGLFANASASRGGGGGGYGNGNPVAGGRAGGGGENRAEHRGSGRGAVEGRGSASSLCPPVSALTLASVGHGNNAISTSSPSAGAALHSPTLSARCGSSRLEPRAQRELARTRAAGGCDQRGGEREHAQRDRERAERGSGGVPRVAFGDAGANGGGGGGGRSGRVRNANGGGGSDRCEEAEAEAKASAAARDRRRLGSNRARGSA